MAKMRKCALLVLCAIMLGCGDSKDSQKKQSTQEQTQESKAQGQDCQRNFCICCGSTMDCKKIHGFLCD